MIYLMRHGADCPDRYGGWSEYGLTGEGRRQVELAKAGLADRGISEIYSSDLARAKETAEIVAAHLGLPVTYLPQFRESNNGRLAGMPKREAGEKYPGLHWSALDWTEPWPGGESPEQFYQRIKSAWLAFRDRMQGKTVLLVSHGGVMNVILCIESGTPYTNKETRFRIGDAEIVRVG